MSSNPTGFVVVTTDGTTRIVQPPAADAPGGAMLELLYREMDVEMVDVVHLGGLLFADEEGLINDSPVNGVATAIAIEAGLTHQPYVGDVLFARTDEEGDAISLTAEQVAWLTNLGASRS